VAHRRSVSEGAKRRLLRPLVLKSDRKVTDQALAMALQVFESQTIARLMLPDIAGFFKAMRASPREGSFTDLDAARLTVGLGATLLDSGRISHQLYVFIVAQAAERIHDQRTMNGSYDDLLAPVISAIQRVERESDLGEDEYFCRGTSVIAFCQSAVPRPEMTCSPVLARLLRNRRCHPLFNPSDEQLRSSQAVRR
jgi:hypothetical protein